MDKPDFDLNLRELMQDSAWRRLLGWSVGLCLTSSVLGLFLGNQAVLAMQPWGWMLLLALGVPVLMLSALSQSERPWPRWMLVLMAACALAIVVYLACAAWLSLQGHLPWQSLRYVLMALNVLSVSLIVRRLAQRSAQSFSDKDTP